MEAEPDIAAEGRGVPSGADSFEAEITENLFETSRLWTSATLTLATAALNNYT